MIYTPLERVPMGYISYFLSTESFLVYFHPTFCPGNQNSCKFKLFCYICKKLFVTSLNQLYGNPQRYNCILYPTLFGEGYLLVYWSGLFQSLFGR